MKILKYCLWIPFLCAFSTFAQQASPTAKTVSGTVTNHRGEPLANANVTIKSGKGTVTNAQGKFSLKNVSDDDDISISFIGYARQTIPVEGKSTFRVVMQPAKNELDEVVVQGYGITSKRLATGNIATVSAEEIKKHPVLNPIQILQGLTPGALVTNASGASTSSLKIEIRGRNTIDPGMLSEPLYIVDGVPLTVLNISNIQSYAGGSVIPQGSIQAGIASEAGAGQSPFVGINPNDIESIEVLKDADATAIYGSRASNGVVLITTKKGKEGKTKMEFNLFSGYSQITRYYDLLNTRQYVEMRKEALANDNLPVNLQTAPDLLEWDTAKYTDWQKYTFGKIGRRTSAQATLSGGDNRTNFRASSGYDFDRDILTERGGNYRGSFSLNVRHKSLNQRFIFSWSALYSISKIDATNRSTAAVLLPPNAPPIFNDNGNLNHAGWGSLSNRFPFSSLLESYTSRTNFLNNNISLSYEIMRGLIVTTSIGYNNSQNNQNKIIPIASQDPSLNPKGNFRVGNTNFHNLIIEPKVEHNFFISKGKLTALVGGTVQTNETEGFLNNGTNYTNDLLLNSINNAPNKGYAVNNAEYKYTGVFGRVNYNWMNKYIINLNARRDGSSRFGPGRRFGNFGSIGAAWIISEEKLIKQIPFISFGKLRASYGLTGSDQILDYQYLSRWNFGSGIGLTGVYNTLIPLYPAGFSDSLLQWEVNKKLEASISLGILKDRISFEVSWYQNICGNQLVSFPTPSFAGFISVTSNTPAKVKNSGLEIIAGGKFIERKNLGWSIKATFSMNRNKLVSYPNISQSPFSNSLVIGKPLNIQRVLHFTGIDPQNGSFTFEDLNHDGNVNVIATSSNDDRYPIVLNPKFDGGFTNSFRYRNLSFDLLFYYRNQLGRNFLVSSTQPGIISNQSVQIVNRWQKPGDIATIGKYSTRGSTDRLYYYNYSDSRITDASFIRLQNISISYFFSENIRKKLGASNLKIYIQAENLLVFTNYKGIDPEVQTVGAMPRPKIVTAGLLCNF